MPKNHRARTRAARALMDEYLGLGYTQALAMLSPNRQGIDPALLAAYPDEEGVDTSQLGWRILLPDATPAQKATAEAIWEPVSVARPCRCSGQCRHGRRCGEVVSRYTAGQLRETPCEGRLVHTGRIPEGLLRVTQWLDIYSCRACDSVDEVPVTLPGLPWGRLETSDLRRITIVVYPTGHLGAGSEGARIDVPLPGDVAPKMARDSSGVSLGPWEADRELRRAVARAVSERQAPTSADSALAAIRPLWEFVTPDAVRYILTGAAEDVVERSGARAALDIAAPTRSSLADAILSACAAHTTSDQEEQADAPPGARHDALARRAADDPAAEHEVLWATAVLLAAVCAAEPEIL